MKKLTTEQFIEKAIVVHGNKYHYDNVVYTKNSQKVIIECVKHGYFQQRPADHMRGDGCPKCKFDLIASQKRGNIQQFIDRANIRHNNRYNYTNSVYINAISKVEILCEIHGSFFQTPDKHLGGTGCPKCSHATSRGERKIQSILDELGIKYEREKRFSGLVGSTSNSRLRYDFWLPTQKLLIEYDGEHHFNPVNTKGRLTPTEIIDKHNTTIENDKRKDTFAADMGYRLIRIPYTDYNILSIDYFHNLALEILPHNNRV